MREGGRRSDEGRDPRRHAGRQRDMYEQNLCDKLRY